jgi:hypothetical protein
LDWGRNMNQSGLDGPAGSGAGGGGGEQSASVNTLAGDGGAGVVVLSYGDYLEVTRSPEVSRPGALLRNSILLQASQTNGLLSNSTASVSVTASSNVLTLNGVLLTQSYSVAPHQTVLSAPHYN